MTDMGEPGSSDSIAITVWNKNGGLWFASHWDGTKTVEQILAGGNLQVRPAALMVDGEKSSGGMNSRPLTDQILTSIFDQAIVWWRREGADDADLNALRNMHIEAADLDGQTLGYSTPEAIYIDRDASGYGWFVDATPSDSLEFRRGAAISSEVQGRVDLLTVIAHEIGHAIGFEHDDHEHGGVMADSVGLGVRRLPGGTGETAAASYRDIASALAGRAARSHQAMVDSLFADREGKSNGNTNGASRAWKTVQRARKETMYPERISGSAEFDSGAASIRRSSARISGIAVDAALMSQRSVSADWESPLMIDLAQTDFGGST
jgi:hypothetical protein